MTYMDIPKNVSFTRDFRLMDDNSEFIDVTDATGICIIKKCRKCTDIIMTKSVDIGDIPENGELEIDFVPSDTVDLPVATMSGYSEPYQYFITITLANGDIAYRTGPMYLEPSGVSDDAILVNVFTGYEYARTFIVAGESVSFTASAIEPDNSPIDIVGDGWDVVFVMKKWWDYESSILTKKLSLSEVTITDTNVANISLLPSETEQLDNSVVYTIYIEKEGSRIVIESGYLFVRRSA